MQIPFLVFKISEENKFLWLYKKFLKNLISKKKISKKFFENFSKFNFCKKNYTILYFLIANLILECFQLSFHIHIVNVGQKL